MHNFKASCTYTGYENLSEESYRYLFEMKVAPNVMACLKNWAEKILYTFYTFWKSP
jgi:hypothetical protein